MEERIFRVYTLDIKTSGADTWKRNVVSKDVLDRPRHSACATCITAGREMANRWMRRSGKLSDTYRTPIGSKPKLASILKPGVGNGKHRVRRSDMGKSAFVARECSRIGLLGKSFEALFRPTSLTTEQPAFYTGATTHAASIQSTFSLVGSKPIPRTQFQKVDGVSVGCRAKRTGAPLLQNRSSGKSVNPKSPQPRFPLGTAFPKALSSIFVIEEAGSK